MKSLRKNLILMVILIAVAASNCATSPEPYEYGGFDQELQTGPGELKEGSGLFSGEDGTITIYQKPARTEKKAEEEEKKNNQ